MKFLLKLESYKIEKNTEIVDWETLKQIIKSPTDSFPIIDMDNEGKYSIDEFNLYFTENGLIVDNDFRGILESDIYGVDPSIMQFDDYSNDVSDIVYEEFEDLFKYDLLTYWEAPYKPIVFIMEILSDKDYFGEWDTTLEAMGVLKETDLEKLL